jgi:DNA-binding transcriptional MerR regulator
MDRHLSPAETAKRFGISIKALRLYEEHGLLRPLRTTNGARGTAWRVYGADQIARLVQILALKRLGFSLARIGELLKDADALDPILALQERMLVEDGKRVARALILIRKARAKRASGEALSIDDLAALAQETVMTKQLTCEEQKKIEAPLRRKHFTPEENASLDQWKSDNTDILKGFKALTEEAEALMASGDTTSEAAMDFARRIRARARQIKGSSPLIPVLAPKLKALWDDVRSDPETSQKLSPTTDVVAFIGKVVANLKAQEGDGTGEK